MSFRTVILYGHVIFNFAAATLGLIELLTR